MIKVMTKGERMSIKWTATLDEVDEDLRTAFDMIAPNSDSEAFNFVKEVFVGLAREIKRGGDIHALRQVLRRQLWRTRDETECKSVKIV